MALDFSARCRLQGYFFCLLGLFLLIFSQLLLVQTSSSFVHSFLGYGSCGFICWYGEAPIFYQQAGRHWTLPPQSKIILCVNWTERIAFLSQKIAPAPWNPSCLVWKEAFPVFLIHRKLIEHQSIYPSSYLFALKTRLRRNKSNRCVEAKFFCLKRNHIFIAFLQIFIRCGPAMFLTCVNDYLPR